MTVKSKPTKYLHCAILLTVVTLLTCYSAALESTDSKAFSSRFAASHRTFGADLENGKVNRRLRTTEIGDEERAISGLTKVKDLTGAGATKLQKLAGTAKNKFSQHITFKLLGKANPNLIGSKQFEKWAAVVAKANKNNPEAADVAMVSALARHYGDDALASMLAAAKQSASTKATATRLENVQLKTWLADGRNADNVFNLLKLDEAGANVLKSPALDTWMAYTTKLKKDPYDLLLFKLKPRYEDDAGLAKMLVLSKNDPTTRAIAEKLETVQLDKWVIQKKNMIDVFRLLKLNEEGTTLLKSPVLSTWVSYVEKLQKNPYKLLFSAIKTIGFDDVVLAKMIATAKQDVNTGSIAGKMEQLQIKKWALAGKSGDDLFQLLGLRKEGDNMFESPVWDTWVSYVKKKEFDDPNKALFSVLRNRFGDERLTSMVAKAKEVKSTKDVASKLELDVWHMNGQTSEEVFKLLKLKEKGDKVFESPAFSTWVAYVRKLGNVNNRQDPFMTVTQLENSYGHVNLARLLAKAKQRANTEATKDVIVDLQRLQFKKWVIQGNDPKRISEIFGKNSLLHRPDNERVRRDFQAFYMFNFK